MQTTYLRAGLDRSPSTYPSEHDIYHFSQHLRAGSTSLWIWLKDIFRLRILWECVNTVVSMHFILTTALWHRLQGELTGQGQPVRTHVDNTCDTIGTGCPPTKITCHIRELIFLSTVELYLAHEWGWGRGEASAFPHALFSRAKTAAGGCLHCCVA